MTQLPVVNAEIVVAFSLTVMFVFLGTYIFKTELFSFWTLLIGHVSLSLPFVYISVKPKLQQMDPSLYEAAIDLGAKPHQALWKVIIPEVIPGRFIVKTPDGYYISEKKISDVKGDAHIFDDFNKAVIIKKRYGGKVIKL